MLALKGMDCMRAATRGLDQEQGAFLISASTRVAARVAVYRHIGTAFVPI